MIPYSLKRENENYFTLPVLRKFCKKYGLSTTDSRSDLMESIIQFGAKNKGNANIVREWADQVLKEGIKHIYFRKVYFPDSKLNSLKNTKLCDQIMVSTFSDCPLHYLTACSSENTLSLQSYIYEVDSNDNVTKISFFFSILLLENNIEGSPDKVIFPVFVDLDLVNCIVAGRAKSKSGIFFDNEAHTVEEKNRTNSETIIIKAIEYIVSKLGITQEAKEKSSSDLRQTYYKLLKEFTFTPAIVKQQIDSKNPELDEFITNVFTSLGIDLYTNIMKAKNDMRIFIEKYISINCADKTIFTKDRAAYPVKLIATDSELTKVETTTSNKEPLQCKPAFFDNKNSLEHEQACDGLVLCYNRINTKYFGTDPYVVKLHISKGYGVIRFESYVEEEDIQNVLSRIIKNR
ncbi:MAG: SAP domain-containing protein [Bacillota bacterium]